MGSLIKNVANRLVQFLPQGKDGTAGLVEYTKTVFHTDNFWWADTR